MGQGNIFTFHFMSLWLLGIVYSTSILYKKSSLKIHTKIISRVWELLNKRGWPHGKGEAIAPGVGVEDAPGAWPLLGTARVTQECQQEKLGVCCQTSSIKTLPATGRRRNEQRNLLKEAGRKASQLAGFFGKVLRPSPQPLTLTKAWAPSSQEVRAFLNHQRGGLAVTAQTRVYTPPNP